MNNEISPSDVQVTNLWREEDVDADQLYEGSVRCEYSANDFCWSYQKYFLKVTSLEKKGESRLLSKFNFAQLLRDKSVYITNVTEFKDEHYLNDCFNYCKYKLLVSLNRENAGSFLLIVDVKNQCISKCIDCPFRIRNVELIANNSGRQDNSLPFCPELQSMCGIVALSTNNSTIMILDLCLETLTNESFDINLRSPSTVTLVCKKEGIVNNYDLDAKRKIANIHNQHICISIIDECHHKNDFRYDYNEENISTFSRADVYISSLKYFYQTNTLYIGYNFGGVHHFSLQTFNIYRADPLEDENDCLPVVGFSLQEPENDPKNFCYLWVLKGQLVQDYGTLNEQDPDEDDLVCSSICLNVLEFENKNWLNNYGYLYTDFISASARFHYLLTSNAFDQIPMTSIVVNYGVINQGSILSYRKSKEDTTTLDTSLFYIVWQAFDDQIQTCVYYLMLFDLNQWYQAQMPFSLPSNTAQFSSFASFYKLNEIITLTDSGDFQDSRIDLDSFSRYQQNTTNDIFYYPSSLSFKVSLLSDTKHLNVTYLSMQKKILKLLNDENDNNIWLEPDEFLSKCHFAGILNLEDMNSVAKSNKRKYELILSIALDNNELPFLAQTILNWSNQNNELDKYGCNCKLFLDWLWNEVEVIKKLIDEIVVPLFDLSDTYDSKQVLSPLYANESKLKCLLALLNKLKSSGTPTTEQGERELDLRANIIQILIDYIQIILWCCSCNLLPEAEEGNHLTTTGFIYPRTQFQVDYDERRKELVSLNSSLIKHSDLLTIDGLILNTKPIHDLWTTNENPTGLYPPSSIYSLISMYLEDSVPTEIKHQIMLYVLQDIILYLSNRQDMDQVEKLETFQSCFNVDPAIVQSVQGMWALDHQQFDYSLSYFCEANTKLTFPNIIDDFKKLDDDLQRRILTSYLYQNQKHHSLQFIKSSNLFNCDTLIKQKLYISVMLSNKLVLEAYNFQRVCRNKGNIEELLFHFFLGCEEMKLFESVFKFELDPLERDTLIYYLLEISESVNSGNLLIIYLLLNKKFVDAHKFLSIIEERIRKRNLDQDSFYYGKFLNIRSLVNSYIQVLPSSVVKLNLEVNNHAENLIKKKSICNLPSQKPKQVQITRSNSNSEECSNAVKDILYKIEKLSDNQAPTNNLTAPSTGDKAATPFRKRIEQRGLLLSENSPFVKDLTPRKDKFELKDSLISSYSLNYNGDNSFLDNSATTFNTNKQDTSRNTENCSELLSILTTPKIDKQQKNLLLNDYVPSASGPASILKSKNAMNTPNSLSKSSRKKKSVISSKLSFQDKAGNEKEATIVAENGMIIETGSNKQNQDANSELHDFEYMNDMSIDVGSQASSNMPPEEHRLRTPINPSFVFSPPLTRSKKKQGNHSEIDYDQDDFVPLPNIGDSERKQQDEKKSARKSSKRSTSKSLASSKIETTAAAKTPNTSTKVTAPAMETPKHKMSLRTTRVPSKKKY